MINVIHFEPLFSKEGAEQRTEIETRKHVYIIKYTHIYFWATQTQVGYIENQTSWIRLI